MAVGSKNSWLKKLRATGPKFSFLNSQIQGFGWSFKVTVYPKLVQWVEG